MLKRMVIMMVAVGLVFGAAFGFQAFKANDPAGDVRPAQPTADRLHHYGRVATVATRLEAVGSARADNGAKLSAQVSGIVSAIQFQSGGEVEKGRSAGRVERCRRHRSSGSAQGDGSTGEITYDRDQTPGGQATPSASRPSIPTLRRSKATRRRSPSSRRWSITNRSRRHSPAGSAYGRSISASTSRRGPPIVTLQQLDPIYRRLLPAPAVACGDQGRAST